MNLNREDVLYYAQKLCEKGILKSKLKGLIPLFKKVKYLDDEDDSLGFWISDDERWNSLEMAQIVTNIFIENGFKAKCVDGWSFVRVYVKKKEEMDKESLKEMVNECFRE